MNDQITFRVFEVVGCERCVSSEDGQRIYELIVKAFMEGRRVKLSFKNIKFMLSAFLHPAIGQLYGQYDEEFILSHLEYSDKTEHHEKTLKRVITDAKAYFKDPERAERARARMLEEGNV